MGHDTVRGHPHTGPADPDTIDEADLANEMHGNNRLQGDDQSRVRNERRAMPDTMPNRLAERPKGPAQPENTDRPGNNPRED